MKNRNLFLIAAIVFALAAIVQLGRLGTLSVEYMNKIEATLDADTFRIQLDTGVYLVRGIYPTDLDPDLDQSWNTYQMSQEPGYIPLKLTKTTKGQVGQSEFTAGNLADGAQEVIFCSLQVDTPSSVIIYGDLDGFERLRISPVHMDTSVSFPYILRLTAFFLAALFSGIVWLRQRMRNR